MLDVYEKESFAAIAAVRGAEAIAYAEVGQDRNARIAARFAARWALCLVVDEVRPYVTPRGEHGPARAPISTT